MIAFPDFVPKQTSVAVFPVYICVFFGHYKN